MAAEEGLEPTAKALLRRAQLHEMADSLSRQEPLSVQM
jgi:hypothetical protein